MSKDNNKRPEPIQVGKPQEPVVEEAKPEEERKATELPTHVRPNNAIKPQEVRTYTPNETKQLGGQSVNAVEAVKLEMQRYMEEIIRINGTIIEGVKIEAVTERAYGTAQQIFYNLILKVLSVKSLEEFRKQWLAMVVFIRKNKDVLNETSLFSGLNTWTNRKDQYMAHVRAVTLLQTTSTMENPLMVRSVIQLSSIEGPLKRVLPLVDINMRLSHVYG